MFVSAEGFRAAAAEPRIQVQEGGSGRWDSERQAYVISAGARCAVFVLLLPTCSQQRRTPCWYS